jgi:hypothetical protein
MSSVSSTLRTDSTLGRNPKSRRSSTGTPSARARLVDRPIEHSRQPFASTVGGAGLVKFKIAKTLNLAGSEMLKRAKAHLRRVVVPIYAARGSRTRECRGLLVAFAGQATRIHRTRNNRPLALATVPRGNARPSWISLTVPSGAISVATMGSPALRTAAITRRMAASVKGRRVVTAGTHRPRLPRYSPR